MKIVHENLVKHQGTLLTINVKHPYMSHTKLFIINKVHCKTDSCSWC